VQPRPVTLIDLMRRLRLAHLQFGALIILAVALPFELNTPIVALGPIAVTNVEAILYAVIILWIAGVLRRRRLHWTLAHSAVLLWLIVQFGSALFAPIEREAAIKFALRSAGGVLLFFIAADWARSRRRVAAIMSAAAIGAVLSALAGRLEVESGAAQRALLIFKTQATLVGGQLRAGGTFQYANTAAMYWEAALLILIAAGVWWSIERAQRRWLVFTLVAGLVVIDAIILSSSRAAMVSTALALGIMIAADRASRIRSGVTWPAAFGLGALLVLIGVQLLVNPLLVARLQSESDDSWFQAAIHPAQARLTAAAGDTITQTVAITNTSVRVWPAGGARPVYLSYHWIQPAARRVLIVDGVRTRLPRDLAPGQGATVMASVEVPNVTGTLTLQWDLVQEGVTWFGERGSPVAEVNVDVTSAQPASETAPPRTPSRLGSTSSPPRAALWRAGVEMWLAHPLLGIGPDNFRRVYGMYLGQTEFDDHITANSWYVEILATTGASGVLAGLLAVGAAAILARRHWQTLTARSTRALALGLSAALLAFFMHGLVDYFMEFTPTYALFWLIAGLLIGLLTGTIDDEVARTADRV
jgi:hypothetical protein